MTKPEKCTGHNTVKSHAHRVINTSITFSEIHSTNSLVTKYKSIINSDSENTTQLERHSVERMYIRQRCSDGFAATTGGQYLYRGFSQRNKILCFSVYTIWEKAVWFRHPDYNPDRAQELISSYMSRHLSTRNISSKSMHAFLSNLANRQTDRQTDKRTRGKHLQCTSSFVGGNY